MLCPICRRLQYLREKRNGGKSGNGKREQLAGTKASTKGKRDENESSQTDGKQLPWIHVLEIVRRVEAKAAGRTQDQTMWEGQGNPVQETGSGTAFGLHIHKAEPSVERLDKLLPNRQHEGMAEE